MSWADEIQHALDRNGSIYSVNDVLYFCRRGWARIKVGPNLHGGVMVWPNTKIAEPTHVFGKYDRNELIDLIDWGQWQAIEMGATAWELSGRPGWQRLFEKEGIDHVLRWKSKLKQLEERSGRLEPLYQSERVGGVEREPVFH